MIDNDLSKYIFEELNKGKSKEEILEFINKELSVPQDVLSDSFNDAFEKYKMSLLNNIRKENTPLENKDSSQTLEKKTDFEKKEDVNINDNNKSSVDNYQNSNKSEELSISNYQEKNNDLNSQKETTKKINDNVEDNQTEKQQDFYDKTNKSSLYINENLKTMASSSAPDQKIVSKKSNSKKTYLAILIVLLVLMILNLIFLF
jgi:hypothetical protein